MSGTHTPGPWRADCGGSGNQRGGFSVTAANDGVVICGRMGWPHCADESEANARLIAAAPDLLAACKALVEGEYDAPVMPMARAAIAKAEGR
jgi:hypothetical protein